jgi:hemolysin III
MATYTESYDIEFPKQSDAEELANTVTHGAGAILAGVGACALVALALYQRAGIAQVLAIVVYGASLTAVYAASTLSHAIQHPRRKRFFRIADQAMIYCLISGTYTPFIFAYLPSDRQWLVFAVVWAGAFGGFVSKMLLKDRCEVGEMLSYLLLGWLPAAAMISFIPMDCVVWMAIGGILYSVGALFLTFDQRVPFFHATWHTFVLLASGIQFFAVWHFTIA